MREYVPDHPEIRWLQLTGYTSYNQPKDIYCDECGRKITWEKVYEDESHEYICEDCLLFFHRKDW